MVGVLRGEDRMQLAARLPVCAGATGEHTLAGWHLARNISGADAVPEEGCVREAVCGRGCVREAHVLPSTYAAQIEHLHGTDEHVDRRDVNSLSEIR